jgi:hypothetical protein
LTSISKELKPTRYDEVFKDPKWYKTMKEKLKALEINKT